MTISCLCFVWMSSGLNDPGNGLVDVDAGQDGEYIRLQDRDQKLERSQRHGHGRAAGWPERAEKAEAAEHHDEAANTLRVM